MKTTIKQFWMLAIIFTALASCEKDPVLDTLSIDPAKLELEVGAAQKLTVAATPADYALGTVTWTSSDPAVAEVKADGTVTAKKGGKTTVTAAANGKTSTCEVTVVYKKLTAITLDQTSARIKPGATLQLKATVQPAEADAASLQWTSSDPKVATVDATGKVTAVATGSVIIKAANNDETVTAKVEVTVSNYLYGYNIDFSKVSKYGDDVKFFSVDDKDNIIQLQSQSSLYKGSEFEEDKDFLNPDKTYLYLCFMKSIQQMGQQAVMERLITDFKDGLLKGAKQVTFTFYGSKISKKGTNTLDAFDPTNVSSG